MNTKQKSEPTLQKVQFLILKNLSKSLNVSESEILIAIKQMDYDINDIHESWEPAIANHLTGTAPQKLNGTSPKSETPESFSIEDSDFVDWDEIEDELGETALALVQELGLEREAVTRSDFAALKELALSNPVAEDMVNHIGAVGGLSGGLIDEYIRQQRDNAQALADAGNIEFAKTLLQGQIEGTRKTGKGTPKRTDKGLGKKGNCPTAIKRENNNSTAQNPGFSRTEIESLQQQINQLKETVILLESRLSNQSTHYEGLIMKAILTRLKGVLRQLEGISPNHYDVQSMECLGLCI
jgi:hypothetical protein